MKKLLSLLLILALLPLAGCMGESSDNSKIQITATLFPQYDFARHIGGDKVEVTLLLPPGQESHHYDPSPSDMSKISKSDLFIYTGDMMESWAGDIASSVGGNVKVVDASKSIPLYSRADEELSHDHTLDPHIWLDFDNAKAMCAHIAAELILLSPENEAYFTQNLMDYTNELTLLDDEFKKEFENGQEKELVFGGRFAVGYLTRRYNIKYQSAYDSCSANAEPSVQDITALSDFVKEKDIKVVFCEEFSDPKIAREIASANNAEVLVLHSCHNISSEERENGETFISIMRKNLSNIRKGLQ